MIDLKTMGSALEQLEKDRGIPKDKIIEAIEQALAAAYKKDYGKKGQIVRTTFDFSTGATEFSQVKIVVDPSMIKEEEEWEEGEEPQVEEVREASAEGEEGEEEKLIRFNPEHHILLEDAKKIKKDAEPDDEIVFPLELQDDYGRIAAQTAKQIIIQKIREAEKVSVMEEFGSKSGEIVNGEVQRIEKGTIFVDLDKTTGILPYDEQIPGERYRQGERIRAYLYSVEETPRGISLRLSRSHPKFIEELFKLEAPEVSTGVVEIKAIAREAGSRSKIAVISNDDHIDPVGSCVGQRGVRVSTVMSELGGEKIDIIEWSPEIEKFIEDSLSPAKVNNVEINEENKHAVVEVDEDQLSLAIGKGGQNVRLAAKLTGWKIDIKGTGLPADSEEESEEGNVKEEKTEEAPEATPEVEETTEAVAEVEVEEKVEEVKEEEVVTEEVKKEKE